MNLTQEQVEQYKERGVLLIPECFSQAEVSLMRQQLTLTTDADVRGRVLEKDQKTVRALHGCHTTNKIFSCLTRHPYLLNPVRYLLNSEVYIYQFKINFKAAFCGDVWPWHQDFIYWYKEDGMLLPNVINVAIFLDEVNEFNGPMYFIPGSHKQGMLDIEAQSEARTEANQAEKNKWSVNFSADLKYVLPLETVSQLIEKKGIIAPKGPAGSLLLFDSNIVHGSASNISPFDRRLILITYNSVENVPTNLLEPRPEFLVSRDYTPLIPLEDPESLLFATSKNARSLV